MKKILFITPKNPYASISGGTIVTKNAIDILSEITSLDLLYLDMDNEESCIKNVNIKNIFKIKHVLKPKNIPTIVKSLFSQYPLSIYRNFSDIAKSEVSKIVGNYDVVYVDHWLMMQFIPKNYRGSVLLREHNAEYKMWERFYDKEKNLFIKLYLKFEIKKIKRYEKKICNEASYVLTLSENDIVSLLDIGVNKNKLKLLPAITINDTETRMPQTFENKENIIIYIGTFNWDANVDGLDYFLKNVYNKLKQNIPDLKFYIIGKNPPKKLSDYAEHDSSIIFTGFVNDLNPYYKKAKLFITYLRFGSGIKIKILEALAHGLPVVSNEIGLEGINTKATLLCKSNNDFVMNITALINDTKRLKNMSKEAIWYINHNFSKQKFINDFNKVILGDKNE